MSLWASKPFLKKIFALPVYINSVWRINFLDSNFINFSKFKNLIAKLMALKRAMKTSLFFVLQIEEDKILALIRNNFDFKPKAIIERLQLRRPVFLATAAYGHFGRNEDGFSWEKTDKAETLKREAGL